MNLTTYPQKLVMQASFVFQCYRPVYEHRYISVHPAIQLLIFLSRNQLHSVLPRESFFEEWVCWFGYVAINKDAGEVLIVSILNPVGRWLERQVNDRDDTNCTVASLGWGTVRKRLNTSGQTFSVDALLSKCLGNAVVAYSPARCASQKGVLGYMAAIDARLQANTDGSFHYSALSCALVTDITEACFYQAHGAKCEACRRCAHSPWIVQVSELYRNSLGRNAATSGWLCIFPGLCPVFSQHFAGRRGIKEIFLSTVWNHKINT